MPPPAPLRPPAPPLVPPLPPPRAPPCFGTWSAESHLCAGGSLQRDFLATTALACQQRCCADTSCELYQFGPPAACCGEDQCWRGQPSTCDAVATAEHEVFRKQSFNQTRILPAAAASAEFNLAASMLYELDVAGAVLWGVALLLCFACVGRLRTRARRAIAKHRAARLVLPLIL